MSVQIWVMGEVGLSDPNGEAVRLTSRRAWALMAYLALSGGRVVPRQELADLFWPDRGEEQARASLRQELAVVRKALRSAGVDPIEATKEAVIYKGAPLLADVCAMERFIGAGGDEDLLTAAALYRGPLLTGVTLRAPDFDAWLSDERARLKALATTTFTAFLQRSQSAGDLKTAMRAADALLVADPASEAGHRALMKAYLATDSRAEALRQSELCRAALQQAGTRLPEPETQALIDEIRDTPLPDAESVEPPPRAPILAPPPALAPKTATPKPTPPPAARVEALERAVATVLVAHLPEFARFDPGFDPDVVSRVEARLSALANAVAEDQNGAVVASASDRVILMFTDTSAAGLAALMLTAEALEVDNGPSVTPACGLARGQVLRGGGVGLAGVPLVAASDAALCAAPGSVLVHPALEAALAKEYDLAPGPQGYLALNAEVDAPAPAPVSETPATAPMATGAWHDWLGAVSRADLRGAKAQADAADTRLAPVMQGAVLLLRGNLPAAMDALAEVEDLYSKDQGLNPGLSARALIAWARCLKGAPGRAAEDVRRLLSEAQGTQSMPNALMAQLAAAMIQDELGDARGALGAAREAFRLAASEPRWKAVATAMAGRARDRIGDVAGLTQISEGLATYRSLGGEVATPLLQSWLAAAHLDAGETQAGLAVVDEALALVSGAGTLIFEPELLRLQAVLTVRRRGAERSDIEAAFVTALESARRAGAGLIELRSATSFASHLYGLGRVRDAMARLDRGIETIEPGGPMALDMKSALSLRRRVEMG